MPSTPLISFTSWLTQGSYLSLLTATFFLLLLGYTVYYRYLHPLAKYPGPFWASLTNLWKTYHLWNLHLPHTIAHLHDQYGDVVRVGPNDLSFRSTEALAPIYKAGRSMRKTKFYDGFTTFNPNLFGTQDELIHGMRRRQMAHAFSMQSIQGMEHFIDNHMLKLRRSLDLSADSGEIFDLKKLISFYILDVLGDLAFSRSFDSLTEQDLSKLPPINDHIFLACLMGMTPESVSVMQRLAPWVPIPWLQRLLKARLQVKKLTAECVSRRLNEKVTSRNDLLTSLIKAVDPETGERLTELDINTEAFAMIVAGSHTTAGTLTLLFSHLLQNPSVLDEVIKEIDSNLSDISTPVMPFKSLEERLPFTMACINENFRINPVFTMPLPRKVMTPGGIVIDGHAVPENITVFALNHAVQHNPAIWGQDHDQFNPSRFLGPDGKKLVSYLTPFSMGHRMCIGKNMAMMNILKVLTTILKYYTLEIVHPEQKIKTISVGISEKEGGLECRIRRR